MDFVSDVVPVTGWTEHGLDLRAPILELRIINDCRASVVSVLHSSAGDFPDYRSGLLLRLDNGRRLQFYRAGLANRRFLLLTELLSFRHNHITSYVDVIVPQPLHSIAGGRPVSYSLTTQSPQPGH